MPDRIVQSGYAKDKTRYRIRTMTFSEVLEASGHIRTLDKNGNLRTVKVNGSVKTWKRKPNDCRLPFKYGMYEYGYIEFIDGTLSFGSPEPVIVLEELK